MFNHINLSTLFLDLNRQQAKLLEHCHLGGHSERSVRRGHLGHVGHVGQHVLGGPAVTVVF